MRKKLSKQDAEWQMFADFYKIYQDFYEPEDSDKYWNGLADATYEFFKKYPAKFARDMMMAFLESREALYNLKMV